MADEDPLSVSDKTFMNQNEVVHTEEKICASEIHKDVDDYDHAAATLNQKVVGTKQSATTDAKDDPSHVTSTATILLSAAEAVATAETTKTKSTVAHQDIPLLLQSSEAALTITVVDAQTNSENAPSKAIMIIDKDSTKTTSSVGDLDNIEMQASLENFKYEHREETSSVQEDSAPLSTIMDTANTSPAIENDIHTNSTTDTVSSSAQPTKLPTQNDQAETIESIHQSMEYIIPNLQNIPHNILTLLQTFGPLTQSEIEYNLPPTPFLQDIPKILEIMVILNVIHYTDGLYYFNKGDVRSDVVLPHQILGLIEDTEAEIRDSEARILLLKEELKKDVSIKNRGKSLREFMKNLAMKYDGEDGIRGDIVYATALRSLNVEVGLKRKAAAAAAAAVGDKDVDTSKSHSFASAKRTKSIFHEMEDRKASVAQNDERTNGVGTANSITSMDCSPPEEDSSTHMKSSTDDGQLTKQVNFVDAKENLISSSNISEEVACSTNETSVVANENEATTTG